MGVGGGEGVLGVGGGEGVLGVTPATFIVGYLAVVVTCFPFRAFSQLPIL